jgi:hypothetical protein
MSPVFTMDALAKRFWSVLLSEMEIAGSDGKIGRRLSGRVHGLSALPNR